MTWRRSAGGDRVAPPGAETPGGARRWPRPDAASMTWRRSGVGERLARLGEEAPVVAGRVEREREHAEGRGIAQLAAGLGEQERRVTATARAYDEQAHPGRRG